MASQTKMWRLGRYYIIAHADPPAMEFDKLFADMEAKARTGFSYAITTRTEFDGIADQIL